MKFAILKENLKRGLAIIERAAGRNITLPSLSNVLISAQKNLIILTSTDLELVVTWWGLAKTEKEGKITTPARLFANVINFFPSEKITLSSKDNILLIEGENSTAQLNSFPADDFPIIPNLKTPDNLCMNLEPFIEALSQVVDMTASTQVRPEIAGVYLNFQKDAAKITTTDSFRLAERTLLFEKKQTKEVSLIIPQKAAREIINIFKEQRGKLTVYFSPTQVMFEFYSEEIKQPQIQIISRIIEGEYPSYEELIPEKMETQITIKKTDFINHLKSVGIFSGKGNEIKIGVSSKKDGLEISAANPETGEDRTFLPAKINGEKMEASFNWRFLIDGLSQFKSQEVIFSFNKEEETAIIRPTDESSFLYIIKPMKSS